MIIYSPHVIQDVHVFLSSIERKLRFLMKTFQDFLHIMDFTKQFKVQMRVSVQLQRALNDTRRKIVLTPNF